jgi:hypothetical protein
MNGTGRRRTEPGAFMALEDTDENKRLSEHLVSGARSEAMASRTRCTNYSTARSGSQAVYYENYRFLQSDVIRSG